MTMLGQLLLSRVWVSPFNVESGAQPARRHPPCEAERCPFGLLTVGYVAPLHLLPQSLPSQSLLTRNTTSQRLLITPEQDTNKLFQLFLITVFCSPAGMKSSGITFVLAGLCSFSTFAADAPKTEPKAAQNQKISLVPFKQIKVEDSFWAPKLKIYTEKTIPHSWNYMQWNVRALQRANNIQVEGDLNGTWDEATLFKFLETAAYSLSITPDPALEKRVDEIVTWLGNVQQPDGYAHVHILNTKKKRWDPDFLDGSHEGFVLGHMIEAAIQYHAATGKKQFLDIATKAADAAYVHFLGPQGAPGFCGHAELELALIELYRVVPNPHYLELSKAFIEWRGRNKVKPVGDTPRAYFQDDVPFREQMTLEGHAVRALFFATGVADVALVTGDFDYRLAANRYWDSAAGRRMNIVGNCGPRNDHEAFGEDYELPSNGYYESCVSCALVTFAHRMFLLEGKSRYADVVERALYNNVLHSISLDGTTSYYQNPLSDKDKPRYNSWVCCPPNISRTLFQVGRYAYAVSHKELFVNLFIGGKCDTTVNGAKTSLAVQTAYPWKGDVKLTLTPERTTNFKLNLRKPGWCQKATVKVNGTEVTPLPVNDHGYVELDREWKSGDVVEFNMDMPVQRVVANPNVKDCIGKVAIQRGPVVYGFEGLDNNGTSAIELGADPQFEVEARTDMLNGISVIKGKAADGKPFVAIPFYTMANRDKSTQEVWAVQQGLDLDHSWWKGRLYRMLKDSWIKK